jgi:serine/threonine-protein kinase
VVIKTLNEAIVQDPNYADFLRKFQDEARRLAICNHPHIVRVSDFFIETDRAYIVMEYIQGVSLDRIIFPNQPLPEATAIRYIQQVSDALKVVHQNGLLHRDVKPENIMLRQGTQDVVLIDFGTAREFALGGAQTQTSMVSSGYTPIEQYLPHANRSPATDIYGLAATLYSLLTAQVPVASILRDRNPLPEPRSLCPGLSAATNQAVLRGMAIEARHRPQNIDEWLMLLTAPAGAAMSELSPGSTQAQTEATIALSPQTPASEKSRTKRDNPLGWMLGLSLLTLLGVTAGAFLYKARFTPETVSAPESPDAIAPSATPEPTKPSPSPSPSSIEPKPTPTAPKPVPSSDQPDVRKPSPNSTPISDRTPDLGYKQGTPVIRGFAPGTSESEIMAALGEPTRQGNGFWKNTRTALYELKPNEITLGYIYDRTSERVRQAEASFAADSDLLQMKVTLNNMMEGRAGTRILTGLEQVQQRTTNRYPFAKNNLKGVIERNQQDRIYIAVWEADLHD